MANEREESLNDIIESIALEELALSHILNTQGESVQYALGTLKGVEPPENPPTIDELIELNKSVSEVLANTLENQTVLKNKLQSALNAATMVGPTGPTGATGPAGASAIIPFSSGEAIYLTSSTSGARSSLATIGQGDGYQVIAPTDPIVIPTITGLGQKQVAFSMPISGTITSICAYLSISSAALIGVENIVSAQLFYSDAPDNSFMPYENTKMDFTVPGAVDIGTVYHSMIDNLAITVSPETRLMMVFYNVTSSGATSSLSGFMSGAIRIE